MSPSDACRGAAGTPTDAAGVAEIRRLEAIGRRAGPALEIAECDGDGYRVGPGVGAVVS